MCTCCGNSLCVALLAHHSLFSSPRLYLLLEQRPYAMNSDPQEEQSMGHPSGKSRPTPLPKMQIFILLMVLLAEPISSTVIYPFVNQFVRDTGITKGDEKRTGYYAGMLVLSFKTVQGGQTSLNITSSGITFFPCRMCNCVSMGSTL